jgi:hypothetical protein
MSMFDFFKRKRNLEIKTEISAHDKWCKVVEKAMNDYNSLSRIERVWFNSRSVIDATNNGGLISYYYNSGAENVYDAIEDIELLGKERIVEIIKEFNRIIFLELKVPTDINERNKYIENLTENADDKLQDLESEITLQIDDLENRLNVFLTEKKILD